MKQTIWGAFPDEIASDWNLPASRCGYNAYTGFGLKNLVRGKKNLVNFTNGVPAKGGKTLLATDKKAMQASLKVLCNYIRNNHLDAIINIENEHGNENKIANTTVPLYCNNLLWAKEVGDAYGISIGTGSEMMPAVTRLFVQAKTNRKERNDIIRYFEAGGFMIGSPAAAKDAEAFIRFAVNNGIRNGMHWQEESVFLCDVLDMLNGYGGDWDGNEFAVRKPALESIAGIVQAVEGRVSNAILFNQDMGKNAKPLTEDQKKLFLELIA